MKRNLGLKITASLVLLLGMAGCATLPEVAPMDLREVTPGPGEEIVVDQLVVLVDVSGSMWADDKYPLEKALVQAFVQAIPQGDYDAAIDTFSGVPKHQWLWNCPEEFDRAALAESASDIDYLGGLTLLHGALDYLKADLAGKSEHGAVVIFSDGLAADRESMDACRMLARAYAGDLCVYTVQIGSEEEGRRLLEAFPLLSDCGNSWTAADINSPSGMEEMIREIFYGGVLDSDGDGVPDSVDECPDTPRGVEVDEDGCPLDSDGDGVYDYQDECPDTPRGAQVDERGCWVLGRLHFDTDKYDIKPQYNELVADVAEVLEENPGVRIRIDGHTDSSASETHNQTLSENRANAVKSALTSRGIGAGRFETRGFGEGRPIRPNTSAENMAMNRRVELTVIK